MSDTQTRLDALEIAYAAAIASRDRHRERAANLAAELERVTAALRRIADENDPLLGIGSEMEFAQETLAGGARAAKENQ
jgi:hypothetical protein